LVAPWTIHLPYFKSQVRKASKQLSNQQFWKERGGEKHMHIIDLRDIVENKETEPDTYEAWKIALWDDTGYAIEDVAENEPTMIPTYDFAAYAQELAEEIGAIDPDAKWPVYCIDWERAARELKMDYTSVQVNSTTYYFRSF
jgi:hypothetical protein